MTKLVKNSVKQQIITAKHFRFCFLAGMLGYGNSYYCLCCAIKPSKWSVRWLYKPNIQIKSSLGVDVYIDEEKLSGLLGAKDSL